MDILMVEDDRAFINRNYHDFEEGKEYTVPDWVGRSFKDKGTAVDPEEAEDVSDGSEEETFEEEAEEAFSSPDERETKGVLSEVEEVPESVEAERTSENSPWWQFRAPDGSLLLKEDGKPLKAQGNQQRDEVLQAVNET
jgi:rRNA maturation endonuclease Nob1